MDSSRARASRIEPFTSIMFASVRGGSDRNACFPLESVEPSLERQRLLFLVAPEEAARTVSAALELVSREQTVLSESTSIFSLACH